MLPGAMKRHFKQTVIYGIKTCINNKIHSNIVLQGNNSLPENTLYSQTTFQLKQYTVYISEQSRNAGKFRRPTLFLGVFPTCGEKNHIGFYFWKI